MGLLSKIFSNTRKPEGFWGRMMVAGMNGGSHAAMASWGLDFGGVPAEGQILDIGCGAGFFSILLARQGHDVTGIDLTESMVREAVELANEMHSSARFMTMDAECLSFPDDTFDVVVSRNVTWNLPHPEQAYAEWLRVLKAGGLLLNYDAEYGKYHHGDFQREAVYAHKDLTEDLVEQCHQIYHMLDISMYDRPRWDLEILQRLGAKNCTADISVGPRLYAQKDRFYAPAPFFGVFARK